MVSKWACGAFLRSHHWLHLDLLLHWLLDHHWLLLHHWLLDHDWLHWGWLLDHLVGGLLNDDNSVSLGLLLASVAVVPAALLSEDTAAAEAAEEDADWGSAEPDEAENIVHTTRRAPAGAGGVCAIVVVVV